MEDRLAAYRRRKERGQQEQQSLINKLKLVITNLSKSHQDPPENASHINEKSTDSKDVTINKESLAVKKEPKQRLQYSVEQEVENELASENTSRFAKWTLKVLKVLLWLTFWGLFIELQFGAVFFSLSLLIFVYFNTRTGPRDNKPSAYSVFNKDCERIQGTLTAEQMQKQMFGIPGLSS